VQPQAIGTRLVVAARRRAITQKISPAVFSSGRADSLDDPPLCRLLGSSRHQLPEAPPPPKRARRRRRSPHRPDQEEPDDPPTSLGSG